MRALVLDFDGVIADSAREAFAIASRTYRDLCPRTTIDFDADATFRAFVDLMPLGNRAEDFGTALAALDEGLALSDQADYDVFRETRETTWLERYHQQFYEVRGDISNGDPAGWRELVTPYRPLLEVLRRRKDEFTYAIATARDRHSVVALLEAYDVADLIAPERIFDKETGRNKTAHLTLLGAQLGLEPAEMTFVDDKANHLDDVATLGVRCALAAWGFNGPREHDLARAHGHLVCTLDDVEPTLFG